MSRRSWYRRHRPHYKLYIYGYGQTRPESLERNWCSSEDIHNHINDFTAYQRWLFKLLKAKREHFSKGFDKGNYFNNTYPLVASNCLYAERVVCCGRKNEWNGTGSCQKWHLCSRCAYIKSQRALKTYLSAYNPNQFVSGTLSFRGYLTPVNEAELRNVIVDWQTLKSAVYAVREEGLILGAYFTEELKLIGLEPIRVIPHLHCLFHVDSNVAEQVDKLSTRLASAAMEIAERDGRSHDLFYPSIALKPVKQEKYFANCLQYATKAIELQTPYEEARKRLEGDLWFMDSLNKELQLFLTGYLRAIANRQMICRIGTMCAASKNYIGKSWSKKREIDYVSSFFDEQEHQKETDDSDFDIQSGQEGV